MNDVKMNERELAEAKADADAWVESLSAALELIGDSSSGEKVKEAIVEAKERVEYWDSL